MKILLLCGGKGTRLFPLTKSIPKPLVKIKKKPIVEYIVNYFKNFELLVCTGYKSKKIEKYIRKNKNIDFTIINSGDVDILERIKDCESLINDDFMVCYGDTIANINLTNLKKFHISHTKAATVCIYSLNSEFGIIDKNTTGRVISFQEKKQNYEYINIGYFMFKKDVFKYIHLAKNWINLIEILINEKQLFSFHHEGIHITVNTLYELENAENKIDDYNKFIKRQDNL